MAKVHKLKTDDKELWVFHCPGCGYGHPFDDRWIFNGDVDKPTFSPSLLVNQFDAKQRCHSFVKDGMIQFLGDCWHELKNQTVEIPEWDANDG